MTLYIQSYKKNRPKIPPPKFLHFYAEIQKIVAYMQKKGVFLHNYERLERQ